MDYSVVAERLFMAVLIGGTFIFTFYLLVKNQQWQIERQQKILEIAPQLNLKQVPNLSKNVIKALPGTDQREYPYILKGEWQKQTLYLFEYHYYQQQGRTQTGYFQAVVALSTLGDKYKLPLFYIRPAEFLDNLRELMGYNVVKIPTLPEKLTCLVFDSQHAEQWSHLPAELWQKLTPQHQVVIHTEEWFIFYVQLARPEPTPADLQTFIDRATHFYETLGQQWLETHKLV